MPQQQEPRPKTVLIVLNVLPLVFEPNASSPSGWDVSWATSATATLYRTLVRDADKYSPLFIGCPEVFVAKSEEAALEKQLLKMRCVPVFLDPPVAHRYFQGFCKGVLWPVFHNVVDVYNSAELQLDSVEEKPRVSKWWFGGEKEDVDASTRSWYDPVSWNPAAQDITFARRVVENYHAGNLVWLHDFHFLMMPSYLLRRLRTALVTMYLHVPFPSSEIFRCLAMRTEILRAMLCADHIGFLIFEHARHFLTSCKRLLGLDYKTSPNGMLVVEYNGRKIHISCSHVEPDVTHLHEMLDQNETHASVAAVSFAENIANIVKAGNSSGQRRLVIGAVDRLEGLTAIPLKLRAFDRFLATHPEKRDSVVLVQIGITLDSRPNDYNRTRDMVLKFTEEINHRYAPPGGVVVHFEEKRKTTCAERVILWRMCDVYMDTCVRGGLSLLPFEYIIAQHRNLGSNSRSTPGWSSPRRSGFDRNFGVMIVSEFAAYSRILSGSLAVNPWKTDDMVAALSKACTMNYYEKHTRFYTNYKFLVGESDATPWGERLLADVEATRVKAMDAKDGETVQVGFGFDFRVMQFESGFVSLDIDDLVKKCTTTSRRLFIVDYGDDESNDQVFQAVHSFAENEPQLEHVVTCTVGKKHCSAKYYVDNMSDILAAMHAIVVRLRLDNSRMRLFQTPRTYSRQFFKLRYLVSKQLLQSINREMRRLSSLSHDDSTSMMSGDEVAAIALSAADISSSYWTSLGAAMAVGCAIGIFASMHHQKPVKVFRQLRQTFMSRPGSMS
ncbi:Trehalose-6-P synthase/phosphatase complex synthase subunit [Phytophthora boehmeriae]|uniref:Trehalose-6-P synthase/phosphatase complex synthase subunit n=1 Tax=Phytophthora boehmeriae TaxID=109152 RepID=A0A8T1XFF4_9STRA|nr:Trehalose-6-P synthase/phosphatase complex synthase subunit [Phytophthora boehmeriae]